MARYTAHHNLFLALLVETGIVGLALFVAVLLGWTRDAWLLANNPAAPEWARKQGLLCLGVLAAYLPHAMLHDVSHTNMVHMFVFFVAGVTACLRRYAYVEGEESHADAESSRLAALPPVPVVAR